MKKLLQLSLVIILVFSFSCSEEVLVDQTLTDDVNIDLSLSKKAPVYGGIYFAIDGFTSFVFYRNITSPDGIFVLNKNKLLVAKERNGDEGVYLAKRGTEFDALRDAFSTGGFESPDDITADANGMLYVADGQAQTVFKIGKNGGSPVAFLESGQSTTESFNPFGITIVPVGFDGPNVDPGDLIVCDNAVGNSDLWAVWAVNRSTGIAKVIAQGDVLEGGPVRASFNSEGTLFVTLNFGQGMDNKMVMVGPDGTIIPFHVGLSAPFFAIHPLTDDIYCKKNVSEIHIIPKTGGPSTLFAENISTTQTGTQDMGFNKQGTSLYISSRNSTCVIEIYNMKGNW